MTKMPMCAYARIGGDAGMQLSRAAFAVTLKFTENIDTFEALKTNIEVIA